MITEIQNPAYELPSTLLSMVKTQQQTSEELDKLIEKAKDHFGQIIKEQIERLKRIEEERDWLDYSKLRPIIIGIIGGDGIGPYIVKEAQRVIEDLLKEEIEKGKIRLKQIEGLTIENRVKVKKAIPDEVLEEIKKCHVLLKGPTTTPKATEDWENIESANVALRRELDLFANVRPIRIPKENIDWTFFRENTEGDYILGSKGINIGELTFDFKLITTYGAERIIRLAFEYAKKNNLNRVTVVTKANVIKTTDGKFLSIAKEIAKEYYPEIEFDDWFIDIFAAKLLDSKRRSQFKVIVLPNLYGDIVTDEAAQLQGGVGTAGSANIGKFYAMFEAIHGTAPKMAEEGRTKYADPSSILRATSMLLKHIGYKEESKKLDLALDICGIYEREVVVTGRDDGATTKEFAEYVLTTLKSADLQRKWENLSKINV